MPVEFTPIDDEGVFEVVFRGRVTRDEYFRFVQALEAFAGRHPRFSVVEVLEGFAGVDPSTWMHGLRLRCRNLWRVERIAVVNGGGPDRIIGLLERVMPRYVRAFPAGERAAARHWLARNRVG